jgi:FkbM family methyltransferase
VTLVAARLCQQVIAFEPDPRSLPLLEDNVRCNDRPNIEIVRAALGEAPGTAVLRQAPSLNTGMSSILEDRSASVGQATVDVIQADQFVRRRPECSPTIIKIDVEGAEHLVLQGARELLARGMVRAIIFEDRRTADLQPTNRAAVDSLRNAGYTIASLGHSDESVDDGMLNFLALRSAP